MTRAYYPDAEASDAVVARARVLRETAGLLSGHAAGDEVPLTRQASLLDDLRTVFATAEVVKLASETVLERLSVLRPAVYSSRMPEALAAALRPPEIAPAQVWIDGANQRDTAWSSFSLPSPR